MAIVKRDILCYSYKERSVYYMNKFLSYFLLFLIYSILGWLMESALVSIRAKKFINRGFLIGPYCPIYGFGGLIITLYLTQYKNNVITVFFLSTLICSILEYITSYLMEKIFKARWWDYSERKFNLNGRICGENAIAFGIVSILVLYFLNPVIETLISKINDTVLLVITIIGLIIFITDTIISCNIVSKLKETASSISATTKDVTTDISSLVKNTLKDNHKIFQMRLIKAFPNSTLNKIIVKSRNALKDLEKNISKYQSKEK